MLLAMASDLRVILIKLADRLHNMRTLDYVRPSKQRRIASETLEIYAPIANRLGLNALYRELQELSFMHKYPMRYRVLAKAIRAARGNRREVVSKVLAAIEAAAAVGHRGRDPGARKAPLRHLSQDAGEEPFLLAGARHLRFPGDRQDTATCYLALGALHGLYKPVPGKFKDYIAIPRGTATSPCTPP